MANLFEKVVRGGPWALVVVIVLAMLAGEYGYLESNSRRAVSLLTEHRAEAGEQQKALKEIVEVLKEQRLIQSQAALLACLRGAKTDGEREECVRRFPLK